MATTEERVGDIILRMRTVLHKTNPCLDYYSRLIARFNFRYSRDVPGLASTSGKTMTINPDMVEEMELSNAEIMSALVCEACHICCGHTTVKDLHTAGLDNTIMSWAMDFAAHRYAYPVAPELFESVGSVSVEELADIFREGGECDKLALDMKLTDEDDVFDIYLRLKKAVDEQEPPEPEDQDEDGDDEDGDDEDGGAGGEGDEGGEAPDKGDDSSGDDSGGDDGAGDSPSETDAPASDDGDGDTDGDGNSANGKSVPRPLMGNTEMEAPDDGDTTDDRLRSASVEAQGANPEAYKQAELSGKVPGGALTQAQATRPGLADWTALLAEDMLPDDSGDMQSYSPLSRLTYSVAQGEQPKALYPSTYDDAVTCQVWFIDTSGSVFTPETLNVMASELQAGLEASNAETAYVVYVDTCVQSVEVFSREDEIILTPTGGGGTYFEPAFAWLDEQNFVPDHVVYVTDGMALDEEAFMKRREIVVLWPAPRDVKLTWLIVNCPVPNLTAPWGSTIHVSHASLYR